MLVLIHQALKLRQRNARLVVGTARLLEPQVSGNQNPSRAVARVRAGESLLVTDRGKPVLRMVPEVESAGVLSRMVAEGTVTAPAEDGLPELLEDLVPEVHSVTDLLLDERARER